MNITICGGGNLGHVLIGVLSENTVVNVNLLTQKPSEWSRHIEIRDMNGKKYQGRLDIITDIPSEVIPQSDMVILCLPGFAIANELLRIKEYLRPRCKVGSIVASTGFFFMAKELLEKDTPLFGFQRVPYIARLTQYGHSANLLGYKSSLNLAIESIQDKEDFRIMIETLFLTPTNLLNHYLEASLSNSNPLLHTSRLYSLWNNWTESEVYDHTVLFYDEWTDEASDLLIQMDREFMTLLDRLPVDKLQIPSILTYYGSTDICSLTQKIRSINAFKSIEAPMIQVESGWIPDFNSRYFTEDFPFGLRFIKEEAENYNIQTPMINLVYDWGIGINKKYNYVK